MISLQFESKTALTSFFKKEADILAPFISFNNSQIEPRSGGCIGPEQFTVRLRIKNEPDIHIFQRIYRIYQDPNTDSHELPDILVDVFKHISRFDVQEQFHPCKTRNYAFKDFFPKSRLF